MPRIYVKAEADETVRALGPYDVDLFRQDGVAVPCGKPNYVYKVSDPAFYVSPDYA